VVSSGRQGFEADEAEAALAGCLAFVCRRGGIFRSSRDPVGVFALVGPAGIGKTSTLAKLAIRHGLGREVKLHFVCADPCRVGVVEPLEAYSRLLEIPLTVVNDAEKLGGVLERIRGSRQGGASMLILIDTPGYGPTEWPAARKLAEALLETPEVETHLAVSMAMKSADLRRTIKRYRVFQPSHLLFTKLDETETHGSAVNEAARTELSLSFFTDGPGVPEDLKAVTPELLARLLLRRGVGWTAD